MSSVREPPVVVASKAATLPGSARLLKPAEFREVFAKSRRYVDTHFTVLVRDRGDRRARIGLAISKRVAKSAVQRNRLKRIIRESFRNHRTDLLGIDTVVMCRPRAKEVANAILFASLDLHWQAIKCDQ